MTKILAIFTLLLVSNPLTYVTEVNDTQKQALAAFNDQQYLVAIYRYEHLIEKLEVKDLNIFLNLAHAYYKAKKWDDATKFYQKVSKGKQTKLASLAYHQLGMIAEINYQQDSSVDNLQIALKQFKQAIIKNPGNYPARYNYELLSKRLEEIRKKLKKNNPNPQNQSKSGKKKSKGGDRKQKNAQGEGDGDKEEKRALKEAAKDGKEKIDEKSSDGKTKGAGDNQDKTSKLRPDQLKAININQEKIKTIFEAMKNKEIHYLQQKRRRNKPGKKGYNKGKPDW
ncbi:hypothetical protein BKI52_31080 [marine bacterium AO1-C]|nr:hypothetical protein BKI52_31080 [marine bacterium AO1-C]